MVDEKIIKRMRELKSFGPDFNSQADVDEFMELVDQIPLIENPDYLPYLIEFLDDDCYIEGVNETLLNDIEYSPAQQYVPYLLDKLKDFYTKARNQFKYLFWTIFNTSEDFEVLKKNIHLADKETLLKLLDDIYKDKYSLPEHKEAIQELRKLLGSDK